MKTSENLLTKHLIAHRGEPLLFPENSVFGFRYALEHGALLIETDVQVTKDDQVVLSHDASLKRLTGVDALIAETNYSEIENLSAGYASRFGSQFPNARISKLEVLCGLLNEFPKAKLFLEIKHECVVSHGTKVFDLISNIIQHVTEQIIIISFNAKILEYIRKNSPIDIGWVVPNTETWHPRNQTICEQLNPEFLFCEDIYLPQNFSDLWQGKWQWAIYTINEFEFVYHYENYGIDFFESDNISQLIEKLENK